MKLIPTHDNIIFKFVDKSKNGFFVETTKSGILLDYGKNHSETGKFCRVGTVTSIGDEVEGIKVGDNIVIQNLMWTAGFMFNGQKHWMTQPNHVLGFER